jgi:ubiquinone/menaquinone biosynthesis C-methylase UbiE
MLPAGLRRRLRRLRSTKNYERLYEALARKYPPDKSVGSTVEQGDYEAVGRGELSLLLEEGLKPGDTLIDFGCGTGRLAIHAIPWLADDGRYIGIDISKTMLAHARAIVGERVPSPRCSVMFIHQTTPNFPLLEMSVDMICAYSVLTHMEHEDSYRYLQGARRIIKKGGKFIYSCLPIEELAYARAVFESEASLDVVERWTRVRNVTTSRVLMDTIARMAGWEPIRWRPGDAKRPGEQSQCVLVPA